MYPLGSKKHKIKKDDSTGVRFMYNSSFCLLKQTAAKEIYLKKKGRGGGGERVIYCGGL